MSDFGTSLYADYVKEVGGFSGPTASSDEDQFIMIANDLHEFHSNATYKDKKDARKKLRKQAVASAGGIIAFFILRALIGWIIDKLLDNYWGK
jgi:F0F1-type ATP synthase assembly protein I